MAISQKTLRDFETVKGRILEPLLQPVDGDAVQRDVNALTSEGCWADVDYADMSTVHWKPLEHLQRVLRMARAYRAPGSALAGDKTLQMAIFRALDFWLSRDFRRRWWYEAIGTPGVMSHILLLLDEELTPAQRTKGLEIVGRATLTATGQNLVWMSSITVRRGLLEKDAALIKQAYRFIAKEIRISGKEGIQPDFSFHQHGPCLYNHGYSAGFAVDCSATAVLVTGTQFAFSQDVIDVLSRYILDGSQWMARGSTSDHGAVGRQIVRRGQSAGYLAQAARNMLALPTGRADEFRALEKRAADRPAPALEGNRHFWRSDFMAHHRKAFYTSARMYSTRIFNTDGLSGCDEGQKSHFLADGTNFLYVEGNEYLDIFPAWDWQKVPGTTVALGPEQSGEPRRKGSTDFVGGVSDGEYGLAAFDFERDGLTARKAWFFFDREYACLGAGISGQSEQGVVTTLNQCHLKGAVTVLDGKKGRRLNAGAHVLDAPFGIYHNEVAYVFPEPCEVHVSAAVQRGSWKLISLQSSDEAVAHEVFKAWIDHGTKPDQADYAYIVAPGLALKDAAGYAADPGVAILRNSADVQAVYHVTRKIAGMAFYRPGQVAISRDLSIGADRACLALVRRTGRGLAISVSNPKNKKLVVTVTVTRKGKETPVVFDLPGGFMAGKTETQRI